MSEGSIIRKGLSSPDWAPSRVRVSESIDLARLSYHVIRPNHITAANAPLMAEAYRCWSGVWRPTFMHLDQIADLPSDDLTRQHEILALFHDHECIGLTAARWLDLSAAYDREDSYFRIWPSEAIEALLARGRQICTCSHFTVSSAWRRRKDVPVMALLAVLHMERFLATRGDALVGTPRTDRGMHSFGYRLGWERLATKVKHHNVYVDLIAFFRTYSRRASIGSPVEDIAARLRKTWRAD